MKNIKISKNQTIKILLILVLCFNFAAACGKFKSDSSKRDVPLNALERARKNVEEGKGISIKNVIKRGSTNYEFSSSNPLWRASLEILNFMPLTTVDYSGGIIITDWYNQESNNDSLKITIRFLTNEIRSDSLNITIHKKTCDKQNVCKVQVVVNSKIKAELTKSILVKAALLEKEPKVK